MANLGDPADLVVRAEKIQTPQVSQRALEIFKQKFVLLGRAVAHKAIIDYVTRLQKAIENSKAAKSDKDDVSEGFQKRIDDIFLLTEDPMHATPDKAVVLDSGRGALQVNGSIIIDGNHAEILKMVVNWLQNERPEVLQSLLEGIKGQMESGALFRK